MELHKSSILYQLERQILPLHGFKKLRTDQEVCLDCKEIEQAFPHTSFPTGCTHEFIVNQTQDAASTNGFITAILSKLLKLGGVCLWISASRIAFPAALAAFNISPEQLIFLDLKSEKNVLFATEEALKCSKLVAVVADIKNLSFKESRRFQLAAEHSRVTGFLIRNQQYSNTIASVSRWRITSLPSSIEDGMPGVGFPKWKVHLLKIRNGTPASWTIEWSSNNLNIIKEQEDAITGYEGLNMVS